MLKEICFFLGAGYLSNGDNRVLILDPSLFDCDWEGFNLEIPSQFPASAVRSIQQESPLLICSCAVFSDDYSLIKSSCD